MTMGSNEDNPLTMKELAGNYLAIVRRGKMYWKRGAILFTLIIVGGLAWVIKRPRVYKSEATIQVVETPQPGQPERNEEEIQHALEARASSVFGSRAYLLQIINDLGLFPTLRGTMSSSKLVGVFQGALERRVERDVLKIGFTYKDAATAQQVVQRLIRLFTDERRMAAQAIARQALETVNSQLSELEGVLSEKEDRLERFMIANQVMVDEIRRRRNPGIVLGPQGTSPGRNAPAPVDPSASTRTRRLRIRLGELQRQVDQLRNPAQETRSNESEPEAVQHLRRTVQERRDALAQLRARGYTDEYPGVQTATRSLREAENQLNGELARMRGSAAATVGLSPAERAARIDQLQREMDSTRSELAASERADQAARGTPSTPTADAGSTVAPGVRPVDRNLVLPTLAEVEAQYDRLNADLTTTRETYQRLQERKLHRLAELNQIQSAGSETIRVIDPPSLPVDPEPPGRAKLAMIVGLVALIIGAGSSLLAGFIDTRVYEPGDVTRWGEIPDLPSIPDLSMDAIPQGSGRSQPPTGPPHAPPPGPG